jgi:hypothetical protein
MAFQRALRQLAFGARFALGRFADAMGDAIGRCGGFLLGAAALLAGAAEVDEDAQGGTRIHFLRNASIETTFVASASRARSVFLAAGSAALTAAAAPDFVVAGAAAAGASGLRAATRAGAGGLAGSVTARGSSLKPNGTDGSLNPVIESKGMVNRSGLREKLRLTEKASAPTSRSQNSCWRMIAISSG